MNTAVGPAVGCLMATFGTSLITDCIFDFDDPEQLQDVGMEQRLELWGLQVSCKCIVCWVWGPHLVGGQGNWQVMKMWCMHEGTQPA